MAVHTFSWIILSFTINQLLRDDIMAWKSLLWRHNGRNGVSNHQPHHCLLNRLLRLSSKKTSRLHVTGLCAGNSPVTGEFSAQMASYAENVSIWWRHHGFPHSWPFVWEETTGDWWIPLTKAQLYGVLIFCCFQPEKLLNKQWKCVWSEYPWRSSDITVMIYDRTLNKWQTIIFTTPS